PSGASMFTSLSTTTAPMMGLYRRTRYRISKPTPFVSAGRRMALQAVLRPSKLQLSSSYKKRQKRTKRRPVKLEKSINSDIHGTGSMAGRAGGSGVTRKNYRISRERK